MRDTIALLGLIREEMAQNKKDINDHVDLKISPINHEIKDLRLRIHSVETRMYNDQKSRAVISGRKPPRPPMPINLGFRDQFRIVWKTRKGKVVVIGIPSALVLTGFGFLFKCIIGGL